MKKYILFLILGIFIINFIGAIDWNDGSIITYYDFNEGTGTNVDDLVTHTINGTLINSPTWQGGILGSSLNYTNTTNTYVNYTETFPGFTNYSNFSISFWIYPNKTGINYIIGKGKNWIIYQNNLKLSFVEWSGSGYQNSWASTNDILNTGVWQHIVITNNGTTPTGTFMYVNGTQVPVDSGTITGAWTNDAGYLVVGKHPDPTDSRGFYGGIDELGIWNISLSPSEVSELYNFGDGLSYGGLGILTFPINNANITTLQSFNASATPRNYNLTNSTIYIWYSNLTLYNSTTNSLSGNSVIYSTWNMSFISIEDGYLWNVRTCEGDGASGNCSFAPNNLTFNVKKLLEFNQTYSNSVTSASNQRFEIVVNSSNNYALTIPYLYYNGTAYEGSFTKVNNDYFIYKDITIPSTITNTNYSFYWNLTLNDSTFFISSTNNQTASSLTMDDCSSFTNQIFNFTLLTEETQVNLTNSTIEYAFNVYDSSRTITVFSYNKTSSSNPTLLCVSNPLPLTSNYSLDGTLKFYGNESYISRYYNFLNLSLTNSTVPRDIILYDSLNSSTLPFLLTFRNSQSSLAANILVYVNKQYLSTNDFKTVELPITDTNGQTILNLVRNTATYNLIMTDITGAVIASFTNLVAFCQDYTIGSCSIDLSAPNQGQLTYNYNRDIGISYEVTYLNSSKIVALAFNSLNSSSKTVQMVVRTENQFETQTICDSSLTTTTGTITCDLTDSIGTNQFFFIDIYSNGGFVETVSINTNPNLNLIGGPFGKDGYFIALLLLLSLILMFSDDRQILTFVLGLGWVTVVSLGLIRGAIFGIASGGIWLVITIIIFIWKLRTEETP